VLAHGKVSSLFLYRQVWAGGAAVAWSIFLVPTGPRWLFWLVLFGLFGAVLFTFFAEQAVLEIFDLRILEQQILLKSLNLPFGSSVLRLPKINLSAKTSVFGLGDESLLVGEGDINP